MAEFFQLCSSFDTEIELYELLLSRYSNIEYIMRMDVSTFGLFVLNAKEQTLREQIRLQWNSLLPLMSVQMLKYMSFDDYFNKCTGRNVDLRPTEDILAEVEAIRRKEN